jgi:hypothetical protein
MPVQPPDVDTDATTVKSVKNVSAPLPDRETNHLATCLI